MSDFGEAAFGRIASMRAKLVDFSPTHHAGAAPPKNAREVIERRIALGTKMITQIVDPDDGFFIGYDFGTSTTKAVLRHPYRSGEAFAVPVPSGWASMDQPHLWPTVIWHDPVSGRFSLLPTDGWRCLQGFKSALIEGLGHRNCCGAPVLVAEAAAAFLACHMAYVIGAALEQQPTLKVAGINIGVPVAALADMNSMALIERSIRLGLSLIGSGSNLTKAQVHGWRAAHLPVIPFTLHTELSGAIAGYCMAPRYYLGGHMIIDCGSATLDMASFALDKPDWPIGIYSAKVEPLGADSCATYHAHGATVEDCRSACRYQEFDVYRQTRSRRAGFSEERGKYPYQIILIGGGIHSDEHEPLFERMSQAFHRPFHLPELARDLNFDMGTEPGRLILADGLARAPIDLRDVSMPGDRPPPPPDPYPEMISKDQV